MTASGHLPGNPEVCHRVRQCLLVADRFVSAEGNAQHWQSHWHTIQSFNQLTVFSFRESAVRMLSFSNSSAVSFQISEREASMRRGVVRWVVIVSVAAIAFGVGGVWYWLSAVNRQNMYA